jgi:transposase
MRNTRNKFLPEVLDRAVRIVGEHRADYGSEWAGTPSITAKIGCTAETLRRRCREEASRRAYAGNSGALVVQIFQVTLSMSGPC